MPMKPKRATRQYSQSVGSLALADESLGVLQKPEPTHLSLVLYGPQSMTEEASGVDGLAPATGIIIGVCLSMLLWYLIILVMYWIHVNL